MSRIKDRVARLEASCSGSWRLIVVAGPVGLDVDAALAACDIARDGRDLTVVVGKPKGADTILSVDGVLVG